MTTDATTLGVPNGGMLRTAPTTPDASTTESTNAVAKKQKIVHLSQKEWVKQRPESFYGDMNPASLLVPQVVDDKKIEPRHVTTALGFMNLIKEGFDNALDNIQRDPPQTYIHVTCKEGTLTISNDGSAMSTLRDEGGKWPIQLAFGELHAGSNFNTEETGKKENVFTAGLNGVGSKGLVIFATRFVATVTNKEEMREAKHSWERNMDVVIPAKCKELKREPEGNVTKIEWTPDYDLLAKVSGGTAEDLTASLEPICEWFAYSASFCSPDSVVVKYNGRKLKLTSPQDFCKAFGGVTPFAKLRVPSEDGSKDLCHLCLAVEPEDSAGWWRTDATTALALTHTFVNGTPCREGTHSKFLLEKIADIVQEKAKKKRDSSGLDVHVTPSFVAKNVIVVGTLLIVDPKFSTQDKHCLTTPVTKYGWALGEAMQNSEDFVSAIEKSGLVDRAIAMAKSRQDAEVAKACKTKANRVNHIVAYEPARKMGTPKSTLVVTEGISAKNFAVAGLSQDNLRLHYGVYPIRGKFLNPRGKTAKVILENKECNELIQILGLQLNTPYTEEMAKKLPYQQLMILSDQDVDGSHIAGLLCNFVHYCVPSLLSVRPNFVVRFATSLIRAVVDKKEFGFYSQYEYERWLADMNATSRKVTSVRYFKGLGTSSAALAKQYFRDLEKNTIIVKHTGEACTDSVDLVFSKKRQEDRKAFLREVGSDTFVDYSRESTTHKELMELEVLPQYGLTTIRRAIPRVSDGFKDVLCKVFYGARKLHMTSEISVAKAAGKIQSLTNYHHRGTAMEDAIIHMAADYAGMSNLTLLLPMGQFGTRHSHVAASAAYPNIKLNAPLHAHLFPPEDDDVLDYLVEEGESIEPVQYVSVIPTVLCDGANGIAVGWSTSIPMFHPVHVTAVCLAHLQGGSLPLLTPYYRGFHGPVEAVEGKENAWTLSGVIERKGTDVHVLDVPPLRETDAYKEDWSKRFERVPDVHETHTDERVHLVLKNVPDTETLGTLGLVKEVGFSNVHLIDGNGRLKRYSSPYDIVRDHAVLRLALYTKRLARQVEKAMLEYQLSKNRARYVRMRIANEIDMSGEADDDTVRETLQRLDFFLSPENGYDYLMDLPDRSFTIQRAGKFEETMKKKESEVTDLMSRTPEGEWKRELLRLQETLKKDPRL